MYSAESTSRINMMEANAGNGSDASLESEGTLTGACQIDDHVTPFLHHTDVAWNTQCKRTGE